MQTRIDELESQRAQQLGQVAEQLKQSHQADRELREITGNLLGALKSNSVRGAWGEAQLRNIVESAGLIEHVDFDTQTSVTGDQGRQRPDMILHLPGGKTLPIDAKVPFTSYILATDANLAGAPDEEARRRNYLAQHVKAVRSHVDALANRAYWKALPGSPDFVVAFIPSESLLSAALEADPTLLDYAFGKRVALASPVALWSVLRTVAFAWQQDLITQDARKLFDLAQELYDRVRVVGEHADKLGRSLENAVGSYNKFVSSLETRVLVTARKFTRLDMSEVIPSPRTLDEGPRSLVAPELVADAVGDGQHPALRADDATPAEDATPAGDAPGTDPRTEQNLTPHE
ncbi:MAG TPA: DNA recombination protein RmuC [Pseudoclavibacter sp.]|nr:DNA recombination protein RmuC [Pseudoclavibacter sp.]